jgi:hypothetical protein
MIFSTPKGISVPFPEQLTEGYDLVSRESGGYHLRANIDGPQLQEVVRDLIELVPDPGFLILESPCNEVKELELRKSETDPFHRDVYYLDGLERWQVLQIFDNYAELLVHDGYIHFGFGSHSRERQDEIFVGSYKIISIFATDPSPYEKALHSHGILRQPRLITAWDTFSVESPGIRRAWSRNGFTIYEMIERLIRDKGLYHAKIISD